MKSMLWRAWVRLRLQLAERAIDHPFKTKASRKIDRLIVAVEGLGVFHGREPRRQG